MNSGLVARVMPTWQRDLLGGDESIIAMKGTCGNPNPHNRHIKPRLKKVQVSVGVVTLEESREGTLGCKDYVHHDFGVSRGKGRHPPGRENLKFSKSAFSGPRLIGNLAFLFLSWWYRV